MTSVRILATSLACVAISTPSISAQDLSKYREFRLGTSLVAVARQAGITPEAHVLHQRPELIQELMWLPAGVRGSQPQGDSVRKVLFSFYNDQLFRIVASYDPGRTEGLTIRDMVEALSATYGPAILPATEIMPLATGVSIGTETSLAQWEDAQHSLNLVRPSNASTFGLVVVSKPLEALARAASAEAIRLDEQEAPQRELDRQLKRTEERQDRQDEARRVNKMAFRP